MKKDICDIEDIGLLVNTFYSKVLEDTTIGYIFKNAEGFSFEKHIPIMISFWNTLLFGTMNYKGNPMIKHIELNKTIPLKGEHFKQWLLLWEQTVNEKFEGATAKQAISKAKNIAGIMQLKIANGNGLINIPSK